MDEGSVPQDGRVLVLNPAAYWAMANGLSALYVLAPAAVTIRSVRDATRLVRLLAEDSRAKAWQGRPDPAATPPSSADGDVTSAGAAAGEGVTLWARLPPELQAAVLAATRQILNQAGAGAGDATP
jgi:hypothetical protein